MGETYDSYTYDSYGNITLDDRRTYDWLGNWIEHDTDARSFDPADTTQWLVSLLRQETHTSVSVSGSAQGITRTTSFTPNTSNGDLSSMTIEPNGDASVKLTRVFGRDSNGRLTTITDTSSSSSRTATYRYQDADGVYVSSVIDPLTTPSESGVILVGV